MEVQMKKIVKKKSLLATIREMFGRVEESVINGIKTYANSWYAKYDTSEDTSQSDYDLTKAVWFANEYKGKGKKMKIGATLGKPIVKTAVSFALGDPFKVSMPDGFEETEFETNRFLKENHDINFDWIKYGMRDGDGYVRMLKTGRLELLPAETVIEVVDVLNMNKLLGYDITTTDVDKENNNKKTIYVEELRTTSPYRKIYKYNDKVEKGKGVELTEYTQEDSTGAVLPLPIVSFHNAKEPKSRYGVSEFQNLYNLFTDYTKIYENAVKNFCFNCNGIPVFEGIEDVDAFIKANTHVDPLTNEPVANWNPENFIIGGSGMTAKILQGSAQAGEAEILLGITFWLICQASETPEFVFGTAVSSSKASVSEQMPVVVRKAKSNQTKIARSMRQLIDLYLYMLKTYIDPSMKIPEDYLLKAPTIVEDDKTLNLKVIETLSKEGVISDKTKLMLAGLEGIVDDYDEELEKAQEDSDKKNEAFDSFNNTPEDQQKALEQAQAELAQKEAEAKSNELQSKKAVKEMKDEAEVEQKRINQERQKLEADKKEFEEAKKKKKGK